MQSGFGYYNRRSRHSPDRYRSLRQVNAFPDNAAILGLVLKGLVQALLELDVPSTEVEQLADDVSALLASALTQELWLHAWGIAKSREWATLHAKHVLGKQPRSHNKP